MDYGMFSDEQLVAYAEGGPLSGLERELTMRLARIVRDSQRLPKAPPQGPRHEDA